MPAAYRHLFGPVPSRRYGRSLGVDLSAPKTCTLDCRFCQLGPTAQTTLERADRPPIAEVLAELGAWLSAGQSADFITASGSGEPTLHLRFGDLFRFVRAETPCRSLLLSNGTLFTRPDVRADAALADVVKISLHAWDQASFERVVRPHAELRFDAILDGYRAFREQFSGRLDLEVFIVPGVNDGDEQVARIAALAASFRPDCVTLNTSVRPPADVSVRPCPAARLRALAAYFGPAAAEAAAELPAAGSASYTDEALIALVSRHPLSTAALASSLRTAEPEVLARLERLAGARRLRLFESGGARFAGPA
jgi:wyosine [tRNA(Phe)-imidazoG37] synthetase (radical SAM superfamily)